jgi:3-isopropylmalate/(R)-2-methylmalate dehydratase large subunit
MAFQALVMRPYSLSIPSQTGPEKILSRASGKRFVRPGEIVHPVPDLVIVHDGFIESAYNELASIGYRRIARPDKVMFVTDHEVAYSSPKAAIRGVRIRQIAREWGITQFYDVGRGGHGHIFPIEQGIVRAGMFLSCYDMHCTNFGSVGALAVAPGAEIVSVLATGSVWEQVPSTIKLVLPETPPAGTTARDVGFYVTSLFARGELPAFHDNRVIEFSGRYVDELSISDRVALCNSLTEIGVANTWFSPQGHEYKKSGMDLASDPDAEFEATIHVDLAKLAPQVALPGGPQRSVDIHLVERRHIDHAFIGSCGSGMYEDFESAAELLRDQCIAGHVRMFVVPGTVETSKRLAADGLLQVFQEAGAIVLPPGCGPCAGGAMGPLADGETSISTAATNHPGRFGSRSADVYLASPLTVAASALAGRISDPRERLF